MATKSIVIQNLRFYPELDAVIASKKPNLHLSAKLNSHYSVKLNGDYSATELSIIEILSLYGKYKHIKALRLDFFSKKERIKSNQYYSIQLAARNGYLKTIQYLETYLTDKEKSEAVKANYYYAFRWATRGGHLKVILHLETRLSDIEILEAVKVWHYQGFQIAARKGYLDTVAHLVSHLSTTEITDAIRVDDHYAIKWADKNGHLNMVKYLHSHLKEEKRKVGLKQERNMNKYRLEISTIKMSEILDMEAKK